MKTRENELDVDFIGGEGPLTKEQEKVISDFIKKQKERRHLSSSRTEGKLATKTKRKKEKV